jgi:hypothetical protein
MQGTFARTSAAGRTNNSDLVVFLRTFKLLDIRHQSFVDKKLKLKAAQQRLAVDAPEAARH